MLNTLEKYKINKSNIDKAYEYHLGLKQNKEYEQMVDDTFLSLVNLFISRYPNVKIEIPRGREKSRKSLKEKIEKLEIERLCKLFAIEGISKEKYDNLYNILLSKIGNEYEEDLNQICYSKIQNLDLLNNMLKNDIPDNMKTALLRITKSRLQKEDIQNNEQMQLEIEEKYGITAVKRTNELKDNLLHWECIENIKNDENEIRKLHSPTNYLKVKDLRAFKIIITGLQDSKKQTSDDAEALEIAENYANFLLENKDILDKMNIEVLEDGYKHKSKQNGYRAEHLKFSYKNHPEYIFEFQIRTTYREDLSRANGTAAHDKRSGKKRLFPKSDNKDEFLEQLKYSLPKYTMLKHEADGYKIYKCNMLEDMLEYYLGYIKLDSNEYKQAIKFIKEDLEQEK